MLVDPPPRGRFGTTRWSLVLAAGGHGGGAAEALASLCEIYWGPVYGCIRRYGHDADESRDLTQEFFAHVLEKDFFNAADPIRGRFRSFLSTSVRHFVSNRRDRATAAKRGGRNPPLSLEWQDAEERFQIDPGHDLTPERLFDYRWGIVLLDRVLSGLGDEYAAHGKAELFGRLKGFLNGDSEGATYRDAAATMGMTEGAVKVAVHRLRRRFRDALLDEIAETVSSPDEIDAELQHLRRSISL